ncbi:hypothetical protein BH11PSE3_BH11PSE3_02220 [soil metagenome]
MEFREAIELDAQDLRNLSARIAASPDHRSGLSDLAGELASCGNDYREQEKRLDAAAMTLRRRWLERAHQPADSTLKSPREGKVAHVPCGAGVAFGYERDLDASLLEGRGETYLTPPAGWAGEVVLCRSGQSALACFVQFAVSRWGETGSLTVGHAGTYFETTALLDSWPQRVLRQIPLPSTEAVDILIVEPVWCDGRFGVTEPEGRARRVVLIDTTMVGPGYDLAPHMPPPDDACGLVIAYSSGLKLDQAGLELAGVAIVRILTRDGGEDAATIAAALREIRGLTGSGLTLDELSALSAPWFMDRAYVDRYTAAIFANNRTLAASIGKDSGVFEARCHPSLVAPTSEAPFCALQLVDASPAHYRRLAAVVEQECKRRALLVTKGGSFGFRGHRFELIEPEPDQGEPFLRVAMGWRAGYSHKGLCTLFAELADQPSFNALDRAYGK